MRNRLSGWAVWVWLCLVGWAGTAGAATIFSLSGVGDPVPRVDVRARGMGGAGRALIGAGAFDHGNFSSANPALLAAFKRPALNSLYFVHRRTMDDGQRSHAISDGDLGAFQLALPLRPGTVFGVGLEALTDIDFGLVDTRVNTVGQTAVDTLQHILNVDVTGGIQAVSLRLGQRAGQKVYLGIRMDLIVMGTITETWSRDFESQVERDAARRCVDVFSGEIREARDPRTGEIQTDPATLEPVCGEQTQVDAQDRVVRTYRGVVPAVGAVFAPTDRWQLGLNLQVERNVKQTRRLRNMWTEGGIEEEVSSEVDIKLPASLGVGVAYTTGYKWMAAFDMERTFWSRTANGRHNTFELAGGILYRMGQADPMSQSRRMEWMAGVHYRSLYFQTTSGSQISEVGASLGVALPFHNRSGKFQYVIEFGKRGDVGQHGVSERFISQTFSFSGWVN